MNTYMVGLGILVLLLGIVALFIPALTRIISSPGNEKVKALVTVIIGIAITAYGYFAG